MSSATRCWRRCASSWRIAGSERAAGAGEHGVYRCGIGGRERAQVQPSSTSTGWWSEACVSASTRMARSRGSRSTLAKTKSQVYGAGHCSRSCTPVVCGRGRAGYRCCQASTSAGVPSSKGAPSRSCSGSSGRRFDRGLEQQPRHAVGPRVGRPGQLDAQHLRHRVAAQDHVAERAPPASRRGRIDGGAGGRGVAGQQAGDERDHCTFQVAIRMTSSRYTG